MRIFTIVGVVLLILLAVWIGIGLTHDAQSRSQLLGVGTGFTSVAGMSEEDVRKAFDEAKACWVKEVGAGNSWHVASEAAAWISFALTALITLFAGAYGRPVSGAEQTAEERAALIEELQSGKTPASRRQGARLVVMVGVLAAAASILTATSSRCEAPAQRHYQRAAKIHGAMVQARKQLSSTDTTPREAQDALETMGEACISPD
jgi:hypothetical protein